jgi:hypothetical protein
VFLLSPDWSPSHLLGGEIGVPSLRHYGVCKSAVAPETVQSTKIVMEPAPRETPAAPRLRERPGWVAIALIAAFVLSAVAMFLIAARLVKRTPAPDLSAVTVVPFAGTSLGVDFSIGLTGALANDRGLRIVTGPSAGAFIEGSVHQAGDRLRVSANLVRAAGHNLLWAHAYDLAIQDVPAVQRDIARDVAATLRLYQQVPYP